jgi:hypothetical protein
MLTMIDTMRSHASSLSLQRPGSSRSTSFSEIAKHPTVAATEITYQTATRKPIGIAANGAIRNAKTGG